MNSRGWEKAIRDFPNLTGNPEGIESLIERFEGQYLGALLLAKIEDQRNDAWLAFWSYLIARPTMRKPFQLTSEEADRLIASLQSALDSPEVDLS